MSLKIIYAVLPVIAVLIFSCAGNDNNRGRIKFENITHRNIFSAEIGQTDTSDWTFTDKWTEKENQLFENTVINKTCSPNIYYRILAYPNPFVNLLVIRFYKDERTLIKMGLFDLQENLIFKYRIVDKDFRIVASKDSAISNDNSVFFKEPLNEKLYSYDSTYSGEKILSDTIFRVYYQLVDSDKQCVYRGHGDIIIRQ